MQGLGDAQDALGAPLAAQALVGDGHPGDLWVGLSRVDVGHPVAPPTCMLAVASPSMPPKVMALVTVAR